MASEQTTDQTDWPDLAGKVLAAGAGTAIGLPFGPLGAVAGAMAGPALEPVAIDIMRRVGQAGKRRSGEVLAIACETAGLSSAEELLVLISENENLQLLAGVAIAAATRTAWEDKVRTLGRSLGSGLLATDAAKIDTEQLIVSAIADIEAPHLALLDLLVAWHPLELEEGTEALRFDIHEDMHSQSFGRGWSAGPRKWYVLLIKDCRPQLAPVLHSLVGTLERHGLAIYESNVESPGTILDGSKNPGPYVEPTALGELVWMRFDGAGATVPHVWVAPAASSES